MSANAFSQKDYENKHNWTLGENKPNSNPIKPNFQKAKMNVNLYVIEDYRKKDDFAVQKNKPNSNPICQRVKMNANVFVTKDYENETTLRLQKNKPNQSQFQTGAPAATHFLSAPPIFFKIYPKKCSKFLINFEDTFVFNR